MESYDTGFELGLSLYLIPSNRHLFEALGTWKPLILGADAVRSIVVRC